MKFISKNSLPKPFYNTGLQDLSTLEDKIFILKTNSLNLLDVDNHDFYVRFRLIVSKIHGYRNIVDFLDWKNSQRTYRHIIDCIKF